MKKKSRKSATRRVVVSVALAVGLSLSAQAGAIVKNGGFESGVSSWWGPGAKGKGNAVVQKEAIEGKSCCQLSSGWICQDKIPVKGGQNYKISMKMRAAKAAPGSAYVQVSFRGGGLGPKWYGPHNASVEGRSEKALYSTGGTHGWEEFSAVIAAPAGADQILIYLRRSVDQGTVWFDDIKIEPTTEQLTPAEEATATGPVVFNGGFEQGQSGWWGPGFKDGKATVDDKSNAAGKASLKLTGSWIAQDKRPVKGGHVYKVTMKARCEAAPKGSAYLQASFRGPGVNSQWRGKEIVYVGKHKEKALIKTGGSHDWKELTTTITAPHGANQLVLYLRRNKAEGAAWFDEFSIEPTGEIVKSKKEQRWDELAAEWLPKPVPTADLSARLAAIIKEAGQQAGTVTFAEDGKPKMAVHVGSKASLVTLNAGIELAEYLNKITGATFKPLSSDAAPSQDLPLIVVGRDNELVNKLCPDIPYDKLGNDGFVIRTVGSNLVIAGATQRGTLYGVYWLLDHHLGVRWFGPEYTYIPSKATLAVKAINELQVPRFRYREVLSREAHNDRYAAHNLLNGRSHGRSFWSSPAEIDDWELWWYAKGGYATFWELLPKKRKAHPEWFTGGQVAMMNQAMRQAMADEIVRRLRALPDYRSRAFNIHDLDWGWDMDKASREFAAKHGGVPSAPRLDMVIDIANRVRKVLPEARFTFNAYHWSFTPPTGMTIPEYVMVFPMDIHIDYSQAIFKGPNEELGKDILNWCKISEGEVLYWNHTVNFFGFLQPTPNLYPIGESIQWLAKQPKITGYFCEDSHMTPGAEFAILRTWLIARLLWNPDQDYRQLIKEFVDGYYGPAAPYIQQYIDLSHEWMVKPGGTLREKTTPDAPYLTFDFLREADELFVKAHDSVKDQPEFLKHVEETRMAVDCTILIRRFDYMWEAQKRGMNWNPDTEKRRERLFANWEASKVRQFCQGGSRKHLETLLDVERKQPAKPEIVKGLPDEDWEEYSDLTINRYGTQIEADPLASDGGALTFNKKLGGWNAQFRRYKLPREGKWDVYAAIRIDKGEAKDDQVVLRLGISPPMNNFRAVKVKELADGKYHWIKFKGSPMTYRQDDHHLVYFNPVRGVAEKIYVDRIVAIRHKGK